MSPFVIAVIGDTASGTTAFVPAYLFDRRSVKRREAARQNAAFDPSLVAKTMGNQQMKTVTVEVDHELCAHGHIYRFGEEACVNCGHRPSQPDRADWRKARREAVRMLGKFR